MAGMTRAQITDVLQRLGWKGSHMGEDTHYHLAIENFQRGWNLGPALLVDGKPGRKTQAALRESLARLKAKQPTASQHFSFTEWVCKCGGRYKNCERVKVYRELLRGLEDLRQHFYPNGLTPVSGYRCPSYNQSIGGASSSQHMNGAACDLPPTVRYADVARLRRFSGIGYVGATGKVAHVDVRHLTVNNNGGYPDHPMTWVYQ